MPVEPPIESAATLADAYALLASSTATDQLTPIAGGTDVMVRITGEIGEPPGRLLDLWRLKELRGITADADAIALGALTTYTDIRRSAACREHLPVLVEAAATIGAAQIQNRGTLGGNIANASPAGDTLPVLLALDAEIVVGGPRGERTVGASDFWVAYRRTALAPDELILRIRIPVRGGREARFRKIGTRRAQAISKVVIAVAWNERAGDPILARRASSAGFGRRPTNPGRPPPKERSRAGRPTPEIGRQRGRGSGRRDPPDRRRPLHRRLPPRRRGPGTPPHRPRSRRLVGRAQCRRRR